MGIAISQIPILYLHTIFGMFEININILRIELKANLSILNAEHLNTFSSLKKLF